MVFALKSKPVRAVIRWQIYATVVISVIAAFWLGIHGATSALLGGFINLFAGIVFAMMTSSGEARSAGDALRTLIRAEATKIALIVLQLWLVLAVYRDVVPGFFFATFVITVLLTRMAFFVRDQ
jgi:ATP synthase protein I